MHKGAYIYRIKGMARDRVLCVHKRRLEPSALPVLSPIVKMNYLRFSLDRRWFMQTQLSFTRMLPMKEEEF